MLALKLLMSMNGPGWGRDKEGDGKRPSQNNSPPDLEEVWNDFTKRARGLFRRKNDGSGGNGGGEKNAEFDPKHFNKLVFVIILIVILAWMATGIYIVDASQRGVVLQFGKRKETTGPGLHWRIPYPIETVEIVNVSNVRSVEVGYRGAVKEPKEALMLTDDENIIDIQFAVQYILKNETDFLFNIRSPDQTVTQAAESAIREMVGKNKMDFLLYVGREQVAAETQKLLQSILDRYQSGIQISKVTMQNAQPPEQVQAAFNDAIKAGQDKERQINEGEAYARAVVPKAEGTRSRILEEANGYKQSVIDSAQGEVSRFLQLAAEYVKSPEVTRKRLYLDTMQYVYSNTSKVLLDSQGSGNLLYLPLDKMSSFSGDGRLGPEIPLSLGKSLSNKQTNPQSTEKNTSITSPSSTSTFSRSREDSLRIRDRD